MKPVAAIQKLAQFVQQDPAFQNPDDLKKFFRGLKRGGEKFNDIQIRKLLQAHEIGTRIRRKTGVDYEDVFFARPQLMLKKLSEISRAGSREAELLDESCYIAAMLYPLLRQERGKPYNPAVLDMARTDMNATYGEKQTNDIMHLMQQLLTVREVNFLERAASFEITGCGKQDDLLRMAHFHVMSSELPDERAVLLRFAQQDIRMDMYDQLSPQEQAFAHKMTVLYYGPAAAARDWMYLRDNLMNNAYRTKYSEGGYFDSIKDLIDQKERELLEGAGIKWVDDRLRREELVNGIISKQIVATVPKNLRDQVTVSARIKAPWAVIDKMERKMAKNETPKVNDVFAARVVVKGIMGSEGENNEEYTIERPLIPKLYRSAVGSIPQVPGEAKDNDHLRKPKASGHEAIHDVLELPSCDPAKQGIYVDVQFTSYQRLLRDKKYAAHSDYKFGVLREMRNVKNTVGADVKTVTVYGHQNNLFTLPRGATVADYLMMLQSDDTAHPLALALSKNEITLSRRLPFAEKPTGSIFSWPLETADEITIAPPRQGFRLANLQELENTCTTPRAKQILAKFSTAAYI